MLKIIISDNEFLNLTSQGLIHLIKIWQKFVYLGISSDDLNKPGVTRQQGFPRLTVGCVSDYTHIRRLGVKELSYF